MIRQVEKFPAQLEPPRLAQGKRLQQREVEFVQVVGAQRIPERSPVRVLGGNGIGRLCTGTQGAAACIGCRVEPAIRAMHDLWLSDQVGPLIGNAGIGLVVADRRRERRTTPQSPDPRHLPSAGNLVDPASLVQERFAGAERQHVIEAGAEHLRKIVITNGPLPDEEVQRSTDTAVHALGICVRTEQG